MKKYKEIDITAMGVEEIQRFCNKIHGKFTGIIYCYTNTETGKRYVGQTISPKDRHKQHITYSGEIYPHTSQRECYTPFHCAIRKYGYDKFKYDVLELVVCEHEHELKSLLDAYERIYIYEFDSLLKGHGYNVSVGGGVVGEGENHPNAKAVDEYDIKTQQKVRTFVSLAEAGRFHDVSDSTIRAIIRRKNYHHKGSIFCYAGDMPDFTDFRKKNERYIYQYTLNGEFIRHYKTLNEASAETGLPISSICGAVTGSNSKTHRSGNYQWYGYRHSRPPIHPSLHESLFLYDKDGVFVKGFVTQRELCRYVGAGSDNRAHYAMKKPPYMIKGYYIRTFKQDKIDIGCAQMSKA